MIDDADLKTAFESIVRHHMDLFPESEVDDLYKLVFQAAMGSEHALADPDDAHRRLKAEADGLVPSMDMPLMTSLSPDHQLVRVHISSFLAAGGDLEGLARAFVKTSQMFTASEVRLSQYWSWMTALAARGSLTFSRDALQRYGDRRRAQGYPAVHHSPRFRRLYRPAYRVVLKALIEES